MFWGRKFLRNVFFIKRNLVFLLPYENDVVCFVLHQKSDEYSFEKISAERFDGNFSLFKSRMTHFLFVLRFNRISLSKVGLIFF